MEPVSALDAPVDSGAAHATSRVLNVRALPRARGRLLIVGPTPPPMHGNAMFIEMVLRSPELRSGYEMLHLDTSDRRSLANLGRLDFMNVLLALKHSAQLTALIARARPDVVYLGISQNRLAYLRDTALITIARAFGCNVVTHLHGSRFQEFYAESGALMRAVIRSTTSWLSAAAVLSESLRGMYAGLLSDDKVLVAGVGVPDPAEESHAVREAHPEGVVTVGYLGMLYRPKGLLELLDAAALVNARGHAVHFEFAGDWYSDDDRDAVLERVAQHGLEEQVEFIGRVTGEAKRRFFERIDLLAFPGYQTEGLPLVILEAMAAHLPVVATSVGAVPDVLEDGVTGIAVPPRDVAALAHAIEKLAQDAGARAQMGQRGRARYLAGYTEHHSMQQMVRLVDRVMGATVTA